MALSKTKVSQLPLVGNIANFDVFGVDKGTGGNARANMTQLKGNVGPTPDITIQFNAIPYGSAPSVVKSGTAINPVFNIGFPLAKNGEKPMLRKEGNYIQWKYESGTTWQNLLSLDVLKLHFSDLTSEEKNELKAPAVDAAAALNDYIAQKESTLSQMENDLQTALQTASDAINAIGEAVQAAEQSIANAEEATQEAAQAASDANDAKDTALEAAGEAQAATGNAGQAAQTASQAAQEANQAKLAAETATQNASSATDTANEINAHPPIIRNGNWWMYSLDTHAYADSGFPSRGDPGKPPIILPNGHYGYWSEAEGYYVDSGIKAEISTEFEENPVRENITSGDSVPGIFGTIFKWFKDFGSFAWKSSIDYETEDITNKPSIPTKTSDLTNDSGLATTTQVAAAVAGGISAHNEDEEAHEDIREAITNALTEAEGYTDDAIAAIPVATDDQNGLMAKEDVAQLQALTSDMEAVKGRALRYPTSLNTQNPTAAQLAAVVTSAGGTVVDGTTVVDLNYNKEYTYFSADNAWHDRGSATVSQATNTSQGIVKGDPSTAGKVYVETDGSMSVIGWDATQTAIGNKVEKVAGKGLSTNDYTATEKTKLDGIESGAQVNVKPNWSAAAGAAAEILNKPTSMPASDVPAWAKASYGITRTLNTDAALNGANTIGVYYVSGANLTAASLPAEIVNNYTGGNRDCELWNMPHTSGVWGIQELKHHYSDSSFIRRQSGATWQPWRKFVLSGDPQSKHKSVTVQAAAWQGTEAPFTAAVSDADIVDGCYVNIWASVASQDIADEAGIYPDMAMAVGSFTLSAKQKPANAIVFKYVIMM